MKITILNPGPDEEDEIIVKVRDLSEDTLNVIKRLKEGGDKDAIAGFAGDSIVMIPLNDIFYFDAVDNKVFAYTKDKCTEVKKKLFEIEREYEQTSFLRVSKNAVVNIKKIERLFPEFNGRL